MNTNKVLLKALSTMLFAALIICLSTLMLSGGRVFADVLPVKSAGGKPQGEGIFGGGGAGGALGGLGSNGYLIIAIVGIVIVVAVLLVLKFVIPKFRAK